MKHLDRILYYPVVLAWTLKAVGLWTSFDPRPVAATFVTLAALALWALPFIPVKYNFVGRLAIWMTAGALVAWAVIGLAWWWAFKDGMS